MANAFNRNIPVLPNPTDDLRGHTNVLMAIKQGLESLAGARGDPNERAVTWNDLIGLKLVAGQAVAALGGTGNGSGTGTSISPDGSVSLSQLPSALQAVPLVASIAGRPPRGARVWTVPITQPFVVPANFVGSYGYAATPARAYATFSLAVLRSGVVTPIGTVRFPPSGSAPVLSQQAAFGLHVGDVLVMVAPDPQDVALADIGITLLLKRTT